MVEKIVQNAVCSTNRLLTVLLCFCGTLAHNQHLICIFFSFSLHPLFAETYSELSLRSVMLLLHGACIW